MSVCKRINELFDILLDEKETIEQKNFSKYELSILNNKIPNIPENIKLIQN